MSNRLMEYLEAECQLSPDTPEMRAVLQAALKEQIADYLGSRIGAAYSPSYISQAVDGLRDILRRALGSVPSGMQVNVGEKHATVTVPIGNNLMLTVSIS